MNLKRLGTLLRSAPLAFIVLLASILPADGWQESLPETAYISGLVGHAQSLSLACESRSAVDWAAFWGVNIDESEFLSNLPSSDNPDTGFVGDPQEPWGYIPPRSYGVHAHPVAVLLRQYGFQVKARHGLAWDDLRAEIAAGRPVIVWIIGQMWAGTPLEYIDSQGITTTVARFEHTMILIGYDASLVHVVDAYSGQTQTYPLQVFLQSWSVLGNMAITGQGQKLEPPAEGTGGEHTYTVQRGDYLTALAERFQTSWQELARLNDISYPYNIYAGQVIQIPGDQAAPTANPKTPKARPSPTAAPTQAVTGPVYRTLLPAIFSRSAPRKRSKATETPAAEPKTYTVQRGDFLIDLGNRLGIDWRILADLNGIAYPYVLYPGQELLLP